MDVDINCDGRECGPGEDNFCPDLLINANKTWNTEDPDISVCLQKTALVWLPCGILWLLAPIQIWRLSRRPTRPIAHTPLNIIRTVLCGGLMLLALADMGYWLTREYYFSVDITDPILRLLTWALALVLIQMERMKGIRNSGLLWTFWTIYMLSTIPRLYSQIRREINASNYRTEMISNMMSLFLAVLQWVLGFFLDARPEYQGTDETPDAHQCPEMEATFPSRLFFGWFDRIAWTGYKRALVKEDLWELSPRDRSSTIVPAFNKSWEPVILAARLDTHVMKHADPDATFDAGGESVRIEAPGEAQKEAKAAIDSVSVFMPLVKTFGMEFALGSVLKLGHDLMIFLSPVLLRRIIQFSETDEPMWRGVLYSCLLLLFACMQTVLLSQYFYKMYLVGLWTKTSLISAIYRKSLRVTSASKKDKTSGEIVNLMSVDCQRIGDMTPYLNMLWSAPLQITVAIIMLYQILGPSVFAGLAVMIFLIPVNGYIAAATRKLQVNMMKQKDIRVKKMNELLQGMKILKLYAWEQSFMEEVEGIRNKELGIMMKMAYLSAGTSFIWSCAPFVVSLVTFATYVLSSPDNVLDSQKAFTSLALFNILRFPLSMLPMMISAAVQASVSIKRINGFMCSYELNRKMVKKVPEAVEAVRIENGSFIWDTGSASAETNKKKKEKGKGKGNAVNGDASAVNGEKSAKSDAKPLANEETEKMLNGGDNVDAGAGEENRETAAQGFKLTDINVRIQKGKLVAVVGSVGSGKSSLLSALLGEMDKVEGEVVVSGRLAYVSQQAWIQNAKLRDNILFGYPLEDAKYKKILDNCALTSDIDILPAGDDTEIGEKGINLSGGQKLRVSLARAVYSDADLYLLDDPLSAVDSHVGRHIFDHVLGPDGCLNNKTRVLVTHAVTFLPKVDQIIVLKNGAISEVGSYRELLAQKGDFADFLMQYLIADTAEDESDPEFERLRQELKSQLGKEEFQRQVSRIRTESTMSDGEKKDGQQRRGSDHSVTSNGTAQVSGGGSPTKSLSPVKKPTPEKEAADPKAGANKQDKHVQYQEEKTETGEVAWRIYIIYFKNMGLTFVSSCVGFYTLYQCFVTFSSIWLSFWADNRLPFVNDEDLPSIFVDDNSTELELEAADGFKMNVTDQLRGERRDIYLGVYGGIGLAQALAAVIASLLLYLSALTGSKALHSKTLLRIMHSPMSFFDTTPQGRIINRFSKDVDVLDSTMPFILRGWLTCLLQVTATFLVIMLTTPLAIIFIFIILIGYYFVQRVYVASSRQLKRLESVSKSPIYSHFGETISGATVIRAYGLEEAFMRESENRVDNSNKAAIAAVVSNRWLAVRLETVGNMIIFASALFAVLSREQLSGGLVGLSVSFALQVTQTLNWLVRMTSEVETNIVAVERLDEYSSLDTEADWDNDKADVPKGWPTVGTIKLEKYSTRYRPGLDLVLRDVTVEFSGGQRVGIVGRTGAGKSSLTLALFRIIEPATGTIMIDGVDVSRLGLHSLRSRLTIIPQDPVLFSGSLRHNLDPFYQYDDTAVWTALRHSHLSEFVGSLSSGLEHEVAEGGENLSVGQRQLICLARALLRKTKILVLDEATAGVDLETDDLIQATIRTEFKDCTIITIAHRLNTVLDYDKILVLKEGQVAELDAPSVLMAKEGSLFRSMCQDAGLV